MKNFVLKILYYHCRCNLIFIRNIKKTIKEYQFKKMKDENQYPSFLYSYFLIFWPRVQEENTRNMLAVELNRRVRVGSPIFNIERTPLGRGSDRSRMLWCIIENSCSRDSTTIPPFRRSCFNPIEESPDLHLPVALSQDRFIFFFSVV